MNEVSSANHEDSTNWRMMGDLLAIERAPINETLIGLSKNRIEGLCHVYIKESDSDRKCDCSFNSFQGSFFQLILQE